MTTDFTIFLAIVPIRPRVAFALAVADKVLPALEQNPSAFNAAKNALRHAWRWIEEDGIRALQLYEDHIEALAVQGSLVSGEQESASMNATISAFYYVLWHAFQQDLSSNYVSEGGVPNDISEVSEDVLVEVCDYAFQTSYCDIGWVNKIASRLANEFRTSNPNDLGVSVSRDTVSSE